MQTLTDILPPLLATLASLGGLLFGVPQLWAALRGRRHRLHLEAESLRRREADIAAAFEQRRQTVRHAEARRLAAPDRKLAEELMRKWGE